MNIELNAESGNLMRVIERLHAVIRDDEEPAMIPIDVADYRHLADEPRVLLVGHRALISVVRTASGRIRVAYQPRRDPLPDGDAQAILTRMASRVEAALG